MLPLVSGTNSRLPSVNPALISPILPHPVLWVALPPSVPSITHITSKWPITQLEVYHYNKYIKQSHNLFSTIRVITIHSRVTSVSTDIPRTENAEVSTLYNDRIHDVPFHGHWIKARQAHKCHLTTSTIVCIRELDGHEILSLSPPRKLCPHPRLHPFLFLIII